MLCNREIKFGEFLKWSLSMGADYVATGHYAQIKNFEKIFNLCESNDKEKDQSYFLSQLTQKELQHVLFPIGNLQKSEVRRIAQEHNLPVATRKDSQGICFVGDLEMKDFLKRELNPQKGKVINENGEEIGEHDGAILYTIGERHGFKINKKEGDVNVHKYYVVRKDLSKNILTVGSNWSTPLFKGVNTSEAKCGGFKLKNLSCSNNLDDIQKSANLSIRIRYRGSKVDVELQNYENGILNLVAKNGDNVAYASGQFGVLYDSEKVLGGGELV
jgi:tRNA-specific 2-thiouridylase